MEKTQMAMLKLVLLGPPGAGKGTQAKSLSEELGLAHISTGDILRQAIQQDSELGKEAKRYVDNGELVPDGLVTKMVIERLERPDAKRGFILDGFPRNIKQAQDLDGFFAQEGYSDYKVIYLDATEKTIIQRLGGRMICKKCQAVFHLTNIPPKEDSRCDFCKSELYQRQDDREETVRYRLSVYAQATKPVVEYYARQGRIMEFDADRESSVVLKEMLQGL